MSYFFFFFKSIEVHQLMIDFGSDADGVAPPTVCLSLLSSHEARQWKRAREEQEEETERWRRQQTREQEDERRQHQ